VKEIDRRIKTIINRDKSQISELSKIIEDSILSTKSLLNHDHERQMAGLVQIINRSDKWRICRWKRHESSSYEKVNS